MRARVETMSYMPTTVGVAMKFMELGRDPESDPSDYSKVISSDSSLSSKLLSLANSSWFGVRNRVTKVQVAVNLLGLGTVRMLAISYCVTGLHSELRLTPDESRMFWSASLCKAVAAREFAKLHDEKQGEDAFAAALFQDFAVPVMYSVAKDQVLGLLKDSSIDYKARLQHERALFRLDHAELGRCIAQKLELPDMFIDAVAFHHNQVSLREFVNNPLLADSVHLASLFPHVLDAWNRDDAEQMRQFFTERGANKLTAEAFLDRVESEFKKLYSYFEQGEPPETHLAELLEQATKELADQTTRLVGTVHELMQQAACAGREVHHLLKQQGQLEQTASHDPLTGLLNRAAFRARAEETLAKAGRYGMSFAIAYLDLDKFKQLNDTLGHSQGDLALQAVAALMEQNVRQTDMVARFGGDEFVVLLSDCSQAVALQVIERILRSVATKAIGATGAAGPQVTMSAGLVWMQAQRSASHSLKDLLSRVDALMYKAKRAGGGRLEFEAIQGTQNTAAA
ncbi:MAG: diguanylate cyclase [Planctomycetota bacterium]|nr:diguanylate cyclase [Planctomycetota bacterium]